MYFIKFADANCILINQIIYNKKYSCMYICVSILYYTYIKYIYIIYIYKI